MNNIQTNPQQFKRFSQCSVAIQIIICLLLLALVIKQSVNFYLKNYLPYMQIKENQIKKQQENNDIMLQNTNHNVNVNQNIEKLSQHRSVIRTKKNMQEQQISPKQINILMKTSKSPINNKEQNIENTDKNQNKQNLHNNLNLNNNTGLGSKNKQKNLPNSSQHKITQQQATKSTKQPNNNQLKYVTNMQNISPSLQQTAKTSFIININIERCIMKLPIFGIMVINIVLLSSYQFLVIMAYCSIILLILNQFVKIRWKKIGVALDLVIAAVTISGFINAYVTPRINDLGK